MNRTTKPFTYIPAASAAAGAALLLASLAGCGGKEAPDDAPLPPATATTGAPGAVGAPDQGKISTGADPDKAPAYPNMYGKPAGAK